MGFSPRVHADYKSHYQTFIHEVKAKPCAALHLFASVNIFRKCPSIYAKHSVYVPDSHHLMTINHQLPIAVVTNYGFNLTTGKMQLVERVKPRSCSLTFCGRDAALRRPPGGPDIVARCPYRNQRLYRKCISRQFAKLA